MESSRRERKYKRLHFYDDPPQSEINIEILEKYVMDRLKLLKLLENLSDSNFSNSSERDNLVKSKLKSNKLRQYLQLLTRLGDQDSIAFADAIEEDNIAHHVLRFAFCMSSELRTWFILREWEWFAARFHTIDNVRELVRSIEPRLKPLEDLGDVDKSDLISSTENISLDNLNVYKVPFKDVPYLVRNRKCLVKAGYAYVVDRDMIFYLQTKFAGQLNTKLITMSKIDLVDERIINIVQKVNINPRKFKSHILKASQRVEEPNFDFDTKSKLNYPLCMRALHELLRKTHHLRHHARMQYGLFIKGMGLSLEEALQFWKAEFTKKITEPEFDRKYSYLFKHQYGQVGSRIDYEPFNCEAIINCSVQALDQHGCPFAHWDKENLEQELQNCGFTCGNSERISNLVKERKYREACGEFFRITHGKKMFDSVEHPNSYYQVSSELFAEEMKGSCGDAPVCDIEDIFS